MDFLKFFDMCLFFVKVSKFQNEFIKSSFLPKYEPEIVRISAVYSVALRMTS